MAARSGTAMLDAYGVTTLLIGFVAALVSAVLSVRWLVRWLTHRGLAVFGWWRLAVGALVATLLIFGVL
jgi:undecaprenyl-diphosphatase